MFFTSAAVLLIGMARWYYGLSTRRAAPRSAADGVDRQRPGVEDVVAVVAGARRRGRRRRRRPRRPTPQAHHRPAQPSPAKAASHPLRPTRQARHAVAVAARPPAGHRNHRARRRTSAPAPLDPADRDTASPASHGAGRAHRRRPRRAVPPSADRRTAIRPLRASPPLRRLRAARTARHQRQRHAPPDLAGALPRRRGRRRETVTEYRTPRRVPHAIGTPTAGSTTSNSARAGSGRRRPPRARNCPRH